MYRIDIQTNQLVSCTFVPSRVVGKTLCVNDDGSSLVVEPNGSQVRTIPAGQDNWDSPWTQATEVGEFLVFRSADGNNPGAPRAYRMLV